MKCKARWRTFICIAWVAAIFICLPGVVWSMRPDWNFPAGEYDCQPGASFDWTVADGIQIIGGPNRNTVVIPSKLRWYGIGRFCDVTSLGFYAFYGRDKLVNITIPDTVKVIEWEVFKGCGVLDKIILPQGIISLGDNAFENCTSLKHIYFAGDAPDMGKNVFRNIAAGAVVHVRKDAKGFGSKWQGLPVIYDYQPQGASNVPNRHTETGTVLAKRAVVYARTSYPSGDLQQKIGTLRYGDTVKVCNYENDHFEIEWKNATAFVKGDDLHVPFSFDYRVTTADKARLYSRKANQPQYVVATPTYEDVVLLLAREGKWCRVRMGTLEGYMLARDCPYGRAYESF